MTGYTIDHLKHHLAVTIDQCAEGFRITSEHTLYDRYVLQVLQYLYDGGV